MWQTLFCLVLNTASRRSFLVSSALISQPKISKSLEHVDEYAHWSFYGTVAPPIERVLSYDDLVTEIQNNNIQSIQIAVQHDCVVATTNEGHRWVSMIPDSSFHQLVMDTKDSSVSVLPIDPTLSKIRNIAQSIFYSTLMIFAAVELDFIKGNTGGRPTIRQMFKQMKSKETHEE